VLNLASSFRLRNKLKERIGGLTGAIKGVEFGKTIGTGENTSPGGGKIWKKPWRKSAPSWTFCGN
jgi:hypothetical protein